MTQSISVVAMDEVSWFIYIIVAIVGGLANSLVSNSGGFLRFYSQGRTIILGPSADMIIGIAAALGVLWAFSPQTEFQLIGLGAIAGFGGSSVLRNLVNSIQAVQSEREATQVRDAAFRGAGTAEEQVSSLRQNLKEVLDIAAPHLPTEVLVELQNRRLIS